MPQKTATDWERTATEAERAADEIDRAEWRLLDALDAGDEAATAAAEDELARCLRRTGRLRPKRAARPVEQPPDGSPAWVGSGRFGGERPPGVESTSVIGARNPGADRAGER